MLIDIKTILFILVVLSAISYYAGRASPAGLAYQAKAAFIVTTFGLIPIAILMLWLQLTAADRLVNTTGIVLHPAIVKSELPIAWNQDAYFSFTTKASIDSIYNFYRNEQNRPGWTIVSDSEQMMILKRDDRELVIMVDNDKFRSVRSIIYSIHKKPAETSRQ
jgi:hypothetical protein